MPAESLNTLAPNGSTAVRPYIRGTGRLPLVGRDYANEAK